MARDRDSETPRERVIRDRADTLGLTMTALAERCGVSRQSFYGWFSPETRLSEAALIALADALECRGSERDDLYLALIRPSAEHVADAPTEAA